MFFSKSTLMAVAAFTSFASAMDMGGSSTMMMDSTATMSSTSPSGSVLVHIINAKSVGGKPVFDPPQVMAAPGDLVQFHFWPMNHSVVQATFADPCLPISQSKAGNGTMGFFSGFMPVSASSTSMPTFTIEVNDTKPIWFYCSQGKHCQNGMVGAINPTAQKTLADFSSRAAMAAENVSPSGDMTTGSESSTGATGTTSGGSSETSGSPTTMTTMVNTGSASSNGTITGAPAQGTSGAPGSVAYLSSSIAVIVAAVAASMLLA